MFPVGASRPGTIPSRLEKNMKRPIEAIRGVYFKPAGPMLSRSIPRTKRMYPSRRA